MNHFYTFSSYVLTLLFLSSCNPDKHLKTDNKILTVIQENCSCKTINKDISTVGITFNKNQSTHIGNTYSYSLSECANVNSTAEAKIILTALKKEIDEFDKIAKVSLDFKDSNYSDEIVFKYGKQISNNRQ